jgi:Nif-specific regulatory protein
MINVRNWIETKKNILICGATGTGKSSFVRKISEKLNLSMYQINVCNLPSELIESELFGHVKGSFTGAINDKKGLCEVVGEGILFIDEVGELDVSLQAKLLQLLEEREYRPVGSNKVIKFKGRIVLATNKDLKMLVRNGLFREDLYFRIITFSYKLESLSNIPQRNEIILKNISFYIKEKTLSDELLIYLKNYQWPGNYRELNNVLEYLRCVAQNHLTLCDLPNYLKDNKTEETINVTTYSKALEIFEVKLLKEALGHCNYHITKCAEYLDISKVTIISKIKKYNLKDFIENQKALNTYGL